MRIYTGNFENMDKILADDKVVVAICLKCPADYTGFWIPELAPTQELLHEYHQNCDVKTYTEKYIEILSTLNADSIYNKLLEFSAEKDVVMLCYEPVGDFCHRHLVAHWLEEQLGERVEEWRSLKKIEMMS